MKEEKGFIKNKTIEQHGEYKDPIEGGRGSGKGRGRLSLWRIENWR